MVEKVRRQHAMQSQISTSCPESRCHIHDAFAGDRGHKKPNQQEDQGEQDIHGKVVKKGPMDIKVRGVFTLRIEVWRDVLSQGKARVDDKKKIASIDDPEYHAKETEDQC